MDENSIIEIETKLAYQEKTIKELNEVVYDQQKAIERLEQGYEKLKRLFNEFAKMSSGSDGPANEKPPHY